MDTKWTCIHNEIVKTYPLNGRLYIIRRRMFKSEPKPGKRTTTKVTYQACLGSLPLGQPWETLEQAAWNILEALVQQEKSEAEQVAWEQEMTSERHIPAEHIW